jgi:hypothetical protein
MSQHFTNIACINFQDHVIFPLLYINIMFIKFVDDFEGPEIRPYEMLRSVTAAVLNENVNE